MKKVLLFLLLFPLATAAQTVKYRKYKRGNTFRYKLTSEIFRDGKFASRAISISEHRVINDGGLLSEEIKWLTKKTYTVKDTLTLDSIARKVLPYKVSLSLYGKVLLPALSIPEMTGEITDLNTFYVAVSPALNAHKLSNKKREIKNNEIRKGNFADGKEVLYGMDCMQVSQKLLSTDKQFSVIETRFSPPDEFCLDPLLDTIRQKTYQYSNNIQMIKENNGNTVNLFWGVEHFTITSKIDKKSGQIVEAAMSNELQLRMRYNCSRDLKSYMSEIPMTINRILKLEIIKQ